MLRTKQFYSGLKTKKELHKKYLFISLKKTLIITFEPNLQLNDCDNQIAKNLNLKERVPLQGAWLLSMSSDENLIFLGQASKA